MKLLFTEVEVANGGYLVSGEVKYPPLATFTSV